MKTIAKITTVAFIVCTLLFVACGKDEDSQVPREKRLKTIEIKEGKTDTIVGTWNYFYDVENRISKIGFKDQNQVNYYTIEFTYNSANNVEKIHYLMFSEYVDFTFTYTANNKIPTKLTCTSSGPDFNYSTDIINNNGTLFWKDNEGKNNRLENANFESNTFASLNLNGITCKFKENNQFKNGLVQKQDMVKLPLLISNCDGILISFIATYFLQISSTPIERAEITNWEALNYQFEKDVDGYIINSKLTSQDVTLIATFHYE